MTNDRNSLLEALLAMVQQNGGKIDSRIRLQKIGYLMGRLGIPGIRRASYEYHYYGPYSREVSDSIRVAVSTGLLEEDFEELSSEIRRYSYRLTETGSAAVSEGELDAQWTEVLEKLIVLTKGQSVKTLELAATGLYLMDGEGLEAEIALGKAIELKPGCREVRDQAKQVMIDVQRLNC